MTKGLKVTFTSSFLNVKICYENNKLLYIENPLLVEFLLILYPQFRSFIPTVQKFSLVYTLLHCCFNITSSYKKFHNEINALKQIFKLNGYPIQFIDTCIKHFLQKRYVTKAIQVTVNKKQLFIALQFLGAQSFLI